MNIKDKHDDRAVIRALSYFYTHLKETTEALYRERQYGELIMTKRKLIEDNLAQMERINLMLARWEYV